MLIRPMKADMEQSIERLTDRIVSILDNHVHSIWLYGSVVLDDFRPGFGHCRSTFSGMKRH